jgi:hypothetical protein
MSDRGGRISRRDVLRVVLGAGAGAARGPMPDAAARRRMAALVDAS